MNLFVRFALFYLAIVCALTYLRDDPVTAGSLLIVAFMAWAIKRGWIAKILRRVYSWFKPSAKKDSKRTLPNDTEELVSQWNKFVDHARVRPRQFYSVLEEKLAQRKVPKIRCSHVYLRESNPVSAKREYLKVRRKRLAFYICGAPFGTGFFVSSRLIRHRSLTLVQKMIALGAGSAVIGIFAKPLGLTFEVLLISTTILVGVYIAVTSNATCYQNDMDETFRQAVHNSVFEAIADLTVVHPIVSHPSHPAVPLMAELFPN